MSSIRILSFKVWRESGSTLRVEIGNQEVTPADWQRIRPLIDEHYFRTLQDAIGELLPYEMIITVDCAGGAMESAAAIARAVERADVPLTRVLIDGRCDSAAAFLVCELAMDSAAEIVITRRSTMLLHWPVRCKYRVSTGEKIHEGIASPGCRLQMLEALARRTGRPEDVVRGWLDASKRMRAEEACAFGLCDSMIR